MNHSIASVLMQYLLQLLVNDDIDIDKASLEQVIAAIGDVEDAIEELGYATVTEVNKDKVKEYIKEHPNE
jgi:uncharacterized protein YoxC